MCEEKKAVLDAVDSIKEIVELFYQQKQKEALDGFTLVIDKILSAIDNLYAYQQNHSDMQLDLERLQQSLTECMTALEDSDYILMSDILQYDFIEYLEELTQSME